MSDNDIDRNLAFDCNLHRGRDDDGQSISGLQIAENRAHRDGRIHDDGDAEQDEQREARRCEGTSCERGAQERKLLLGLATQEPGSAVIDAKGTVLQGVKWQSGQVVDRPWSEHPAVKASIRRQNSFQAAEDRLHAATGASFKERGYDAPAPDAPAYQEVKPATNVVATSRRRHLSKADLELKSKLLKLSTGIRAAAEREDRAAAGTLLHQAKALLDHGQFVAWVERECGLPERTARRYQE